jgi:hypothetical protein
MKNLRDLFIAIVIIAALTIFAIMETFYFVFGLLAILIIIASAIVKVPTAHYGIETVFGKRTGRKFKEGLHLKTPFFGEVLLYPASLATYSLSGTEAVVAMSADNLQITIEGSIQLRPDFEKLDSFVEIPEETIKHGMIDAIESGLGIIAGKENGEDFKGKREAIEHIINCLFLLDRRPDFYINKDNPEEFITKPPKSFTDYISRLELANEGNKETLEKISHLEASKWLIPLKMDQDSNKNTLDTLSFYKQNVTRIETMLQLEASMGESSKVEELYAVDIAAFKLSKVSYSKTTTEALEKKKQAEKDLQASTLRQEKKLEIMTELIKKGVEPGQASNDADAAVGIAPKQIIIGGIPIINLSGGKNA